VLTLTATQPHVVGINYLDDDNDDEVKGEGNDGG
jgi:hypothetical protein